MWRPIARNLVGMAAIIAAAGAACVPRPPRPPAPRPVRTNLPWRVRPTELTAEGFVEFISIPAYPRGDMGLKEVQVYYRLEGMRYAGVVYTPKPTDAPVLLKAMRDPRTDRYARICIARFLLDLENEAARKYIRAAVDGTDKRMLHNAAAALLHRVGRDPRKKWGVTLMIDLIKDDRLIVPPGPVTPNAYSDAFDGICRRLGEMKYTPALRVLIHALARHPEIAGAAEALEALGDETAVPVLLDTLRYRDRATGAEKVRPAQAGVLGRLKRREAVPTLLKHIESAAAIDALGEIGDPRAVAPLKRYLRGPSAPHRARAQIALARLEADDVGAAILQLLKTETIDAATVDFINALARLRERRAVVHLLRFARTSPNPLLRVVSIRALGEIGGKSAILGLIALFDIDFSGLWHPDSRGAEPFFRDIAAALATATGQHLGPDPEAWRKWRLAAYPA